MHHHAATTHTQPHLPCAGRLLSAIADTAVVTVRRRVAVSVGVADPTPAHTRRLLGCVRAAPIQAVSDAIRVAVHVADAAAAVCRSTTASK